MKSIYHWGSLSLLLSSFATVPAAEIVIPARKVEPQGSAGLLNDWLRKKDPAYKAWDIGAQVRIRYEIFDNGGPTFPNFDFQRTGVDNDNAYLLLREKVHVGYNAKWIGVFAEGRDASSSGDDHPANPNTDTFDLHQGYVRIGNPSAFPIVAKVGRQEMIYGDERLVGASDWTNTQRSFDAAKLRYENDTFWVDVFGSRPVISDDHNFNVPDDYDWFSGIYASSRTLLPKHEAQLYFFSRNTSPGAVVAPRDIYTLGTRMKSLPGQFDGWDYGLEVAGQLGSMNLGGKRLDHAALAGSIGGGYTWTAQSTAPRVGLEYNYASGGDDPTKSEAFDNLYPTNHKHYGYMDFIGWKNIHNPRLMASYKATKKLTLTGDYHVFLLADAGDFFYAQSGAARTTNGYGRNPGYSNFAGSELDIEGAYAVNSWSVFKAGYGHFFIGDYIKQSKAAVGGAKDADWIYMQLTFNF
jgi:hypothetical protein